MTHEILKQICLLTVFFLCIAPSLLADDQEVPHYAHIRNVTLSLLEQWPPERYFYLGIGRSPTPIIRFLQILRPEIAKNLPFSSPYIHFVPDFVKKYRVSIRHHFDIYLPHPSALENKTLLLIDFVSSGHSLGMARSLIAWYAKAFQKPYHNRIRALPLYGKHDPGALSSFSHLLRLTPGMYLWLPNALGEEIKAETYKPFSEFPRCDLEYAQNTVFTPRPEYDILGERLRNHMKTDPILEAKLKEIMLWGCR